MIDVGSLRRLVFETTLTLLAANDDVALQSLLIEKKLVLNRGFVALLVRQDIHQLKTGADPEAVAAVYELVDPAVESTKLSKLPV